MGTRAIGERRRGCQKTYGGLGAGLECEEGVHRRVWICLDCSWWGNGENGGGGRQKMRMGVYEGD